MTLKMIDGSARELKEVRCPACGKLLCKVRILRGDAVLVESVCTRSWCRKAVAVEVQERPAA